MKLMAKYVCTLACVTLVGMGYANPNKQITINKILLVVAMEAEATPIIETLHLKKAKQLFSGLPMQGYTGKYANKDIFLITNGQDPIYKLDNVGTQPAVLAAYLGINHFHPDLVISVGTAGGIIESGTKMHDIYISNKIYFHDRRIPNQYEAYGSGGYISQSFDQIADKNKMKKANICTGNSFDPSPNDTAFIHKHNCAAVEMEAASVAWVSMLTNTPMVAIRGVGDMAGTKMSYQDYQKNNLFICNKIANSLKNFIKLLS